MGLSVPRAIHRAMSEALCGDLREAVESGFLEGSGIGGQPFPAVSLVAVALHGMQQAGMLTLAEPDEHGLVMVALTEAGLARYKALIERQRARPDP